MLHIYFFIAYAVNILSHALAYPLSIHPQIALSAPKKVPLHFTNSAFKIVVVSDTHLLDDQTIPGNASNVSRASTDAVRRYLELEKPDFVIHLGDIVSGEVANSEDEVEAAVKQILSPMVDAKVPFATVKGNHDNANYSTHSSITDIEKRYASRLSYTKKAPSGIGGGDTGSDNYWIPIYPHKKSTKVPALILWSFDSRSGQEILSKGSAPIDDWVDPSVADWIREETKAMQNRWDRVPPSLLFVHIPPHASLIAQTISSYRDKIGGVTDETPEQYSPSKRRYPGLNDDLPASTQGGESDTPYAGQDRAFIDAFMQSAAGRSRVHSFVSGHDHGNDWCAPSNIKIISNQIVPLCFAKHSGFGGYDHTRWNHGVRVFKFHLDNVDTSVQTYIRLLTGEKLYDTRLSDEWAITSI